MESLKKVQASQKSQNISVKVSSTKETMTRPPHTKEMVKMRTVVEENSKSQNSSILGGEEGGEQAG